jgi:hypothetical protein
LIAATLFVAGCDFNPLGGNKSKISDAFEPGKYVKSEPPTISPISNFIIDENDVETINFTINDPDTFIMCSSIFVRVSSSNTSIIDSNGLIVGGTYPNCTLRIAPKAYQHGVLTVTVGVFDFWSTVNTSFQLTVNHLEIPGAFSIIDALGQNGAVEVSWQNAAYMPGTGAFTSGFYTLFYRQADTTNAFIPITPVTSPHTVSGLTNGTEYEFYVLATNSVGSRQTSPVRAFPTKFNFRAAAIVPLSAQYVNTAGTAANVHVTNISMLPDVHITDANYPLSATPSPPAPGPENPINGNFPVGTPKTSYLTSPSGRYQVYVTSQGNILSGAER